MAKNTYTADRRLYLDKDGKVVEADDPARVSLLAAAGTEMPLEDAERYGLVAVTPAVVEPVARQSTEPAEGEQKAVNEPRPNKAKAPTENKAA